MSQGAVYTGPFSSEFEKSFLLFLQEKIQSDPLSPKTCLVPSNYLGMHLRYQLVDLLGGHAGVQFLTLLDLAQRLCMDELVEKGRHLLPSDMEELFLEELASSLPPKSKFHEVRKLAGFHRSLRNTFHDLVDGGCLRIPSEFKRLAELSCLFQEHRKNYINRFYTHADLVLEAREFGDHFRKVLQSEEVFIYGFYDLTFTQSLLIESVVKETSAFVWIPNIEAPEKDAVAKPALDLFASWGLKTEELSVRSSQEVHRLSAATSFSEPEDITLWILDQADQLKGKRLAILLRNFDSESVRFHEALSRANLPHYLEGGVSERDHPDVQSVLRLADLLGSDWNRSLVISFLRAFPWNSKVLEETGTPEDWDFWSRKANVTRGLASFEVSFRKLARKKKEDPRIEAFSKNILPFLASLKELESTQSWEEFSKNIKSAFFAFRQEDLMHAEIRNVLTELGSLDEVIPPKSLSTILKILRGRVEKVSSKGNPFLYDSIFVGRLESARGIPFDTIILPGLVEGLFPGPIRNDPLLGDQDREKLNADYGCQISARRTRAKEESFLFHLIKAASSHFALSYPRRDSAGTKEYFPSTFFKETLSETDTKNFHLLPWNQDFRSSLDDYDHYKRHWADKILKNPSWSFENLSEALPFLPSTESLVKGRFISPFLSSFDGILTEISELQEEMHTSATEVQQYLECPFRFLLKYRFKLQRLDAPDDVEALSPLDRGSIVHDILHLFYSKAQKQGFLPLQLEKSNSLKNLLQEVIAEVFEEAQLKYALGFEGLWEAEKSFIQHDLWQLIEREILSSSPLVPKAFEVGFGLPGARGELESIEPLEFSLGRRKIFFKGRMDRVDFSSEGHRARVIDYKTGKTTHAKNNSFRGGKDVQLGIYLLALKKLLPNLDFHSISGQLVFTSALAALKERVFEGPVLENRMRDLQRILQVFFDGVSSGFFPAIPGDGRKNCRFCDFNQLCGRSVHRNYVRKGQDPKFEAIRNLEEIE